LKSSNTNTRDELLTLLRKHIDECVSARDDMTRTIEALLEAERKLLQGDDSAALAYHDEPEQLPYRIQTSPAHAPEVAPTPSEAPPPVREEITSASEDAEEIVLLDQDISENEPEEEILLLEDEGPAVEELPAPLDELEEEVLLLEEDSPMMAPPTPAAGAPLQSRESILEPGELIPEEDAYTLVPEQAKTPGISPLPEFSSPGEVGDLLQEDQVHLLDTEETAAAEETPAPDNRTRRRAGKPDLPFQQPFDPVEDLGLPAPAPAPARQRVARRQTSTRPAPATKDSDKPAKSLPTTTLQQLMNYIRSGGAVRCLDPWDQNCAAFLLGSGGRTVFATDVFMNYLRKSLKTLHALFQESLGESTSAAKNLSSAQELETRKLFLTDLVDALQEQQTSRLHSVNGLRISGRTPLPEIFEFEKSTINYIHAGLLNALYELMQKPADLFFQPGESYSEIADFLGKYKEFTHNIGEEKQAGAMLRQLGVGENPSHPGSSGYSEGRAQADHQDTPGTSSTPDDTSSFMEEEEELQNLNTFDFSPDDKKSIMRLDEKALSSSSFKKIEQAIQPAKKPDANPTGNGPDLGSISSAKEGSTMPGEEIMASPELMPEEDNSFDLAEFEKLLEDDEAAPSSSK
jgi:hypothetical protein